MQKKDGKRIGRRNATCLFGVAVVHEVSISVGRVSAQGICCQALMDDKPFWGA